MHGRFCCVGEGASTLYMGAWKASGLSRLQRMGKALNGLTSVFKWKGSLFGD